MSKTVEQAAEDIYQAVAEKIKGIVTDIDQSVKASIANIEQSVEAAIEDIDQRVWVAGVSPVEPIDPLVVKDIKDILFKLHQERQLYTGTRKEETEARIARLEKLYSKLKTAAGLDTVKST